MREQLLTSQYVATYRLHEVDEKQKQHLETARSKNTYKRNNDISDKTKSKIRRMCATWFELLTLHNFNKKKREQLLPTFITLTYPILQENDLKARATELNKFTIYLQRKGFMKRYLWRAETQANGSLHYHIISDQFIAKDIIRDTWNTCIQEHVAKYGKEPFGTRIEQIRDYNKAVGYVLKYFTKQSDERRIVQGNKWGSSDNLKQIEYYVEEMQATIEENLCRMSEDTKRIDPSEYVTLNILQEKKLFFYNNLSEITKQKVNETYKRNYYQIFGEHLLF